MITDGIIVFTAMAAEEVRPPCTVLVPGHPVPMHVRRVMVDVSDEGESRVVLRSGPSSGRLGGEVELYAHQVVRVLATPEQLVAVAARLAAVVEWAAEHADGDVFATMGVRLGATDLHPLCVVPEEGGREFVLELPPPVEEGRADSDAGE